MESPETHFVANYKRADKAVWRGLVAETTVWDVVFLLWWEWSKEQSSPACLYCLSVSHQCCQLLLTGPLAQSLSPLLLLLFLSPCALQWIPLCLWLSVCHSWNKLCFLTPLCYLFFMPSLSVSLASLKPNILLPPTALSHCHPLSPSFFHLLHVYLSSVDCAGVTESHCLQQQTLFTLLLNKPRGEHDPWWHALASSQHILSKPRRKEEKETWDKNLCLCLQAVH